MAKSDEQAQSRHARWAHLRFAIIGWLLAAPPKRGELAAEIEKLSARTWTHPVSGKAVRFGFSTIERWLYKARREQRDPVTALRRRVRRDLGQQRRMAAKLRAALLEQWRAHRGWSFQLHADNLAALCAEDVSLGPMPSYSTIVRFMKASGLVRQKVKSGTPGRERAQARLDAREVRSFEAEYVSALWHLDFHHGSRKVVRPDGGLEVPLLLGILDDHSRLCCHLQWYLGEGAENLVHGLMQAIQKRGLPRALLTDNGSAMIAAETVEGLARLGVVAERTLAESPYQNAKQEVFWAQVEGRLLAMLEGVPDLTLGPLNEATQAWAEMEYNREVHSELGVAPLRRFLDGKSVARPSPSSDELRTSFLAQESRAQRRSDGTVSIGGVRFEIPSRYRHLERVTIRYASWDLGHVIMVDARTDVTLCRLYPLDKAANASGQRRSLEPIAETAALAGTPAPAPAGMAPLLKRLVAAYTVAGLPPAYIPKDGLARGEEVTS